MRTLVAAAVACSVLVSLGQAQSSEASIKKNVNIGAQELSSALKEFARERALYLIFDDGDVVNQRTTGASGEMTQDEVLGKLLKDTGLTYRYLDEKTVMVVPMATAPAVKGKDDTAAVGKEAQKKSFWDRFRLAQADASTSEVRREEGSGTLEEILVTAQKREERLRDVPLSITALSGDQLDVSTDSGVTEALKNVPGIATDVAYNGAGTLISVRGVQNVAHENGSPTVGFYLDDAPFGGVKHGVLPDASPYDLERIEVLRGPQSTLYGAGSMVGLVRVLTHDPEFNDFGLKARASTSSTRFGDMNYRGDAAVNLPIVGDKLAARAVISYQDLAGWLDRPDKKNANDGKMVTGRLKLKAQPNEQLTLGLSGWISRTDLDMPPLSKDGRTNPFAYDQPVTTDYDVYSFKAEYDFGSFTMSGVSSYLDYHSFETLEYFAVLGDALGIDIGSQTLDTGLDTKIFTQEITLSSSGSGPWKWTLGTMFRDGKDRYFQDRVGYDAPRLQRDASKSIAVYGQLVRSLVPDRLEVTAGLRYFHDEVTMKERSRTDATPADQLATDKHSYERLSPEVTLTLKATDTINLYARYAEGFRSGFTQDGIVYGLLPEPPDVKPDTLRNYEIGTKGDVLSGLLAFELAVFYQDWTKIKAPALINIGTTDDPEYTGVILNGRSGSGFGAEVGLSVRPRSGLTLTAALGWNDLTSDADIASGPPGSPLLVAKGERFDNSPKYSASGSIGYAFPVGGNGLEALFSTSVNYVSPKLVRAYFPGPALNTASSEYLTTVQAMAGLRARDHWEWNVYGENLTNENGRAARSPFGDLWSSRLRPRTLGVQVSYKY